MEGWELRKWNTEMHQDLKMWNSFLKKEKLQKLNVKVLINLKK